MENHYFLGVKISYKWPFSLAMLVYQRVVAVGLQQGQDFAEALPGGQFTSIRAGSQPSSGGFHGHGSTPIAGWFISLEIPIQNG